MPTAQNGTNDKGKYPSRGTPSTTEYWEDFYAEGGQGETTFEWYCTYHPAPGVEQGFKDLLLPVLWKVYQRKVAYFEKGGKLEEGETPALRILHVGCGNSLLAEEIMDDFLAQIATLPSATSKAGKASAAAIAKSGGTPPHPPPIECIVSIDNNVPVIEEMAEHERGCHVKRAGRFKSNWYVADACDAWFARTGVNAKLTRPPEIDTEDDDATAATCGIESVLTYEVQDVLGTTYDTAAYDVIIDKGMLDAFLSTGKEERGDNANVLKFLKEMNRVLRRLRFADGGGDEEYDGYSGIYTLVSRNADFILLPYYYAAGCESCKETRFLYMPGSAVSSWVLEPPLPGDDDDDDA